MAANNNQIREGQLTFAFPVNCKSSKYDDWSFYRNQFNNAFGGAKAIDIVHISEQSTWLIEIKDYRGHRRTKIIDLGDEIAFKVRDTLAGLAAAQCSANDLNEKQFAKDAMSKKSWRIVLHLEQPSKHSKLFPRAIEPANVQIKLKQLLKAVDAHPVVVGKNNLKADMLWTVKG